MKVATALHLERLTARYWVIPSAVILLLMGILVGALSLRNQTLDGTWLQLLAYDASPEGARLLLSSVATATMTVVGVLFSVTVLVLQQASSQYTPRVIETFIRSAFSQLVLGFFTGTFLFCLLLLRQIRNPATGGNADGAQLPGLAVTLAVMLAVLCLGLLIQFVHRIAHAVQSTHIIASITHDTINSILNIERGRTEAEDDSAAELPAGGLTHETVVNPCRTGYLQAVSLERLARALRGTGWRLELRVIAGDYVAALDAPLAALRTSKPLSQRHHKRVQAAFEVGDARTHAQDFRFGIRQLVDIALRALSPGVNDPTTAIEALNGLSSVLLHYVRHCASADASLTRLRVGSGQVTMRSLGLEDVLTLSFEQILQSARNHPAVLRRVLEILTSCQNACKRKPQAEAIDALRKTVQRLATTSPAFRLRDAA